MSAAAGKAARSAWNIWYKPEIVPIVVVVGSACGLAGWYLTRLARYDFFPIFQGNKSRLTSIFSSAQWP